VQESIKREKKGGGKKVHQKKRYRIQDTSDSVRTDTDRRGNDVPKKPRGDFKKKNLGEDRSAPFDHGALASVMCGDGVDRAEKKNAIISDEKAG